MSSCCFSGILGPFGQCSKSVWVMGNFGRPYFVYVGLGAFLMFLGRLVVIGMFS